MRTNARKPRLFGRIIATACDTARRGTKGNDPMIDLLVDAFGATPAQKKKLEALAKGLLASQSGRLRRIARAPRSLAEFRAESAYLIEQAGRRRRARAARRRPDAYQPPTARREEFEGTVDLAGRADARGGYQLANDLSNLAGLSKEQRAFARQFIGRPLGRITIPLARGGSKNIDLAAIWESIAKRSQAASGHMKKARELMDQFEAKATQSAKLLAAARTAGAANAKTLRKQAEEAAVAADLLRREAKKHGDLAYSNVRSAFWEELHRRQPDLIEHLTKNMGLKFRSDGVKGVRGAPFYEVPGGKEGLTLEHMARRNDDPRLAVDPSNLVVSPTTENVLMNEAIRNEEALRLR